MRQGRKEGKPQRKPEMSVAVRVNVVVEKSRPTFTEYVNMFIIKSTQSTKHT